MTVAAAVGIALFGEGPSAAAVELPNPETAGNRSVRFTGGIKKASQSTPLLAVSIIGWTLGCRSSARNTGDCCGKLTCFEEREVPRVW